MEASTLRWIILLAGVVILAAIFVFGNPDKKRKPRASRRKDGGSERREPTLDGGEGGDLAGDTTAPGGEAFFDETEGEPGQRELEIETAPEETPEPAPRPVPSRPAGPPPEKITTLFLLARDNHIINGAELLQAAIKTGMEFGEMNIFHRVPEGAENAVFSMANASKPGYFDRDGWNTFETSGVALFMTLPGPLSALDAWDSLLATARRMSEILQADLLDDQRRPFTRQREAHVREEMRDFDRSKSRQA
jgi:cell division protein ZipA